MVCQTNNPERSFTWLPAADIAEAAGAVEDAGRAVLVLIEEHGERITEREMLESYLRADRLLKNTQDAETMHVCASVRGESSPHNSPPFPLNVALALPTFG